VRNIPSGFTQSFRGEITLLLETVGKYNLRCLKETYEGVHEGAHVDETLDQHIETLKKVMSISGQMC
jgi:hypothetical protein